MGYFSLFCNPRKFAKSGSPFWGLSYRQSVIRGYICKWYTPNNHIMDFKQISSLIHVLSAIMKSTYFVLLCKIIQFLSNSFVAERFRLIRILSVMMCMSNRDFLGEINTYILPINLDLTIRREIEYMTNLWVWAKRKKKKKSIGKRMTKNYQFDKCSDIPAKTSYWSFKRS